MGCTGGEGGREGRRAGGKLAGVGKWARTLNASFSPSEMEIGADRGTNTFRAGRPCTRDGGCVSERFLGGHPFYPRERAHAVHRSFVTAEELLRQSVRIKKVARGTRNGLESEGGHLPTIWPKLRRQGGRRMVRTPM